MMAPLAASASARRGGSRMWSDLTRDPILIVFCLAMLLVVGAIILSFVPSENRQVRVSVNAQGVTFKTREKMMLDRTLGVSAVAISDADFAAFSGSLGVDAAKAPLSITDLAIPANWTVELKLERTGELVLTGNPATDDTKTAGNASVCLSIGDDANITRPDPPMTDKLRGSRSLCGETQNLTVAVKLSNAADLFRDVPVATMVFGLEEKSTDDKGRDIALQSSSIRDGNIWIQSDQQSPHTLNSLDRIVIRELSNGRASLLLVNDMLHVDFRGTAREIANLSPDGEEDLRPSLLSVLDANGALRVVIGICAFFFGFIGLDAVVKRKGKE